MNTHQSSDKNPEKFLEAGNKRQEAKKTAGRILLLSSYEFKIVAHAKNNNDIDACQKYLESFMIYPFHQGPYTGYTSA